MRLTVAALALLATASCARQKYKGAPPEALHTAILHGGGVEVDEEAVLQQAAAAGDLGWIKRAAHQQKVDEIDSKARSEWAERTRRFGRSVTGVSTCGIQ